MTTVTVSHPKCQTEAGHVCAQPSGWPCHEPRCPKPAGTAWGPYWCPRHDQERLDRVTAELEALVQRHGVA